MRKRFVRTVTLGLPLTVASAVISTGLATTIATPASAAPSSPAAASTQAATTSKTVYGKCKVVQVPNRESERLQFRITPTAGNKLPAGTRTVIVKYYNGTKKKLPTTKTNVNQTRVYTWDELRFTGAKLIDATIVVNKKQTWNCIDLSTDVVGGVGKARKIPAQQRAADYRLAYTTT